MIVASLVVCAFLVLWIWQSVRGLSARVDLLKMSQNQFAQQLLEEKTTGEYIRSGIPSLPKVLIRNPSDADLSVTIAQATGQILPVIPVASGGSRIVVLPSAGSYSFSIVSSGGNVMKRYTFRNGSDYTLTFRLPDTQK